MIEITNNKNKYQTFQFWFVSVASVVPRIRPETFLLDIIVTCQGQIGRRWSRSHLSVKSKLDLPVLLRGLSPTRVTNMGKFRRVGEWAHWSWSDYRRRNPSFAARTFVSVIINISWLDLPLLCNQIRSFNGEFLFYVKISPLLTCIISNGLKEECIKMFEVPSGVWLLITNSFKLKIFCYPHFFSIRRWAEVCWD